MKTKLAIIGSTLLPLFLSAFAQGADLPQSARPGTLNYVEGEVKGRKAIAKRKIRRQS
jgi:hypothetical protein